MYYTDEMRRAFNSVPKPGNGFKMDVLDSDNFITLRIHLEPLRKMTGEERKRSIIYALRVKEALEMAGAIVLVIRDADKT